MSVNFRKRVKLMPGINLNISKSGISVNLGIRGANISCSKNGIYINTGLPGSGIYRKDKLL